MNHIERFYATIERNPVDRPASWLGIPDKKAFNGKPEEVCRKVQELKSIFPTGLIISPSHEAILSDTNPANIKALFEEVKNG